jgi:hypothetical protein
MKIIITESHIKNALFKYFDKEREKGNPVKVDSDLFKLFRLPYLDTSLYEYLIEYNGGMEIAFEKTKELISKLPNNIPFKSQLDGELFFGIWDESEINKWNELELSVDVSGELNNAQFYDYDEDEYVYRDASLAEFYSESDMGEGGDVLDIIRDDIKDYLLDNITKYTGILISVEEIDVVD